MWFDLYSLHAPQFILPNVHSICECIVFEKVTVQWSQVREWVENGGCMTSEPLAQTSPTEWAVDCAMLTAVNKQGIVMPAFEVRAV